MTIDLVKKINEMIDSIIKIEERLNNIDKRPKKRRLKKWVKYTLIYINMLCFMMLSTECENLTLFIISKLITLIIITISTIILYKYTDLFEED